jgi:class 3 adenylate cyclase
MWDGCLMSLNVAKSIPDHRIVAYRTALSMANQFNELKKSWIRAEYPAERMFLRVAIASGPIKQVDMGPAQYRQKTIVGDPVVAASALCANSPRDRNIITVEQSVYDAIISDHIKATKISPREMGKAKDLVISAYQIALANQ